MREGLARQQVSSFVDVVQNDAAVPVVSLHRLSPQPLSPTCWLCLSPHEDPALSAMALPGFVSSVSVSSGTLSSSRMSVSSGHVFCFVLVWRGRREGRRGGGVKMEQPLGGLADEPLNPLPCLCCVSFALIPRWGSPSCRRRRAYGPAVVFFCAVHGCSPRCGVGDPVSCPFRAAAHDVDGVTVG